MELVTKRLGRRMTTHMPRAIRAALGRIALRLVSEIRRSIQKRASKGRRYKRGDKWHYASMEGKTPNTDTGGLVQSVVADFAANERAAFVRVFADYARALEKGNVYRRNGKTWQLKARPFLKPAVEKLRPWAMAELRRALRLPGPD